MAHTENWASQRVLEKAGFVHARPLPEQKRMLYRRVVSRKWWKLDGGVISG